MASGSSIEWTQATWNPVAGCSAISPGCKNCYAARMSLRLGHINGNGYKKYVGTAARSNGGRPYFTGKINLDHGSLDIPRHWKKPRLIFVNSMSDLFHEEVPLDFIKRVFCAMVECEQHQFQVLTKRPEIALSYALQLPWSENIWVGTSVENMLCVHRIRTLQKIPAKIRFLSLEPLLGPIPRLPLSKIHWVIVGGESGPAARPMEEDWAKQVRDRCLAYGVPFFFKQWGGANKKRNGRILDGRRWDDIPVPQRSMRRCLTRAL